MNLFPDTRVPSPKDQIRRLVIIPVLFLLLMGVGLIFSIQNLQAFKQETNTLEIVARQRVLRSQYVNNVLLTSQGYPHNHQQTMRELKSLLAVLRYGGTVSNGILDGPTQVNPPPNPAVVQELERKITLINALEREAGKLLSLSPGDPEYSAQLSRLVTAHDNLQSNANLLQGYMQATRQQVNGMIWLMSLLIVLIGGAGITLALQQQRADRFLQENEARFRQIFMHSPIGKILVSPEGTWIRVNPALCHLLGYEEEELLGKTLEEMSHPDDYTYEAPIRQRLINGDLDTYQVTKRYIRKDGSMIWTLANTGVIRNNEGQPLYLIVQLVDISQQRATLEALRTSEAKFRNVVETATDGILVMDRTLTIISANGAANQMFTAENSLVNHSLKTLIAQRSQSMLCKNIEEVFASRHNLSRLEVCGCRLEKPGEETSSEFPMEISLSTWVDPSGEQYCTAIIRDITERKRIEAERQELIRSNKDLEEFAIIASHDLQEPLRKISVYSERLANQARAHLDAQSQDYLNRIQSSAVRMQTLIADLLNYSRVSSRTKPFEPVDLNEIMDGLIAEMDIVLHDIVACVEVEDLPIVEADPSQIRQLFQNLLENAIKYRQDGQSLKIHVRAKLFNEKASPDVGPYCQIFVEDNGIGFDEKYLDRIFKVFQRLHGRGSKYVGTGIGLATCRRIAERHGGYITARSQPGTGSIFIVTLPLKQSRTIKQTAIGL